MCVKEVTVENQEMCIRDSPKIARARARAQYCILGNNFI